MAKPCGGNACAGCLARGRRRGCWLREGQPSDPLVPPYQGALHGMAAYRSGGLHLCVAVHVRVCMRMCACVRVRGFVCVRARARTCKRFCVSGIWTGAHRLYSNKPRLTKCDAMTLRYAIMLYRRFHDSRERVLFTFRLPVSAFIACVPRCGRVLVRMRGRICVLVR